MPELVVAIENPVGLHARPAATFVKTSQQFASKITVANLTKASNPVDAKSILGVLTLAVAKGHTIQINAEGEDAVEALQALKELIDNNFGE